MDNSAPLEDFRDFDDPSFVRAWPRPSWPGACADTVHRIVRAATIAGMFVQPKPKTMAVVQHGVAGTTSEHTDTLAFLADLPRWVAWREDIRNDKPTKVPYDPNGSSGAKANDPSTWGTRAEAERRAAALEVPGQVGIQLGELDAAYGLGGIDLDTCRDPMTGKLTPWAEDIVANYDTYTEVSPSGSGVKLFFRYAATDTLALRTAIAGNGTPGPDNCWGKSFKRAETTGQEHPPAIELFLGRRYFTVTGDALPDATAELRPVPAPLLLKLIQQDGPAFSGDKSMSARGSDKSRSEAALRVAGEVVRANGTYEAFVETARADPKTAGWCIDKGEPENQRGFRRTWEKAVADEASIGNAIRIVAGQLHDMATQGETALIEQGRPIYQRGGALVRPILLEVDAAKGRKTHTASLLEFNEARMIDELSSCTPWVKFDGRARDWLPADPPKAVAQTILSRAGRWSLPRIIGIVTTPTLRPDGTVLSEPGYDAATHLYYYSDNTIRLADAVHNPTRADAETALADIDGLLVEFPFVDSASKSVARSALITPVVRGAMSVAPLHAISARTAGTGKTYLVEIVSAISSGRWCPVVNATDEKETEKKLTGLLLAGYPLISLDNVNGELGGDLLCQAVERPLVSLRALGLSVMKDVEIRTTFFATGNNIQLRGDLVRRGLRCELNADMEQPEFRAFNGKPFDTVLADRGRYVSACLIIVRAYIAAGSPGLLRPVLASYDDWSDTVRSAPVWLGCADPVASMEKARDDDPVTAALRTVATAWAQYYGGREKQCGDIASWASKNAQTTSDQTEINLLSALGAVALQSGRIDATKLGKWLHRNEERIVSIDGKECRFRRAGKTDGAARWVLEVRREERGWGPHDPGAVDVF